ncbi:MAG: hypothetical protein AB7S92_06380 [Parvibaculaceae bacterium]
MTIEREDIVTAVIAAGGGRLTSRVRLQKSVYLLDQIGLGSGFDYAYHHYGPYSRDLDNAIADAKAFDLLEEGYGRRQSDGASYSIFAAKGEMKPEVFARLSPKRASETMRLFVETNVTILELAATIDWLWRFEKRKDWRSEVKKRKSVKAREDRLAKAVDLLTGLGLPPPSSAAA